MDKPENPDIWKPRKLCHMTVEKIYFEKFSYCWKTKKTKKPYNSTIPWKKELFNCFQQISRLKITEFSKKDEICLSRFYPLFKGTFKRMFHFSTYSFFLLLRLLIYIYFLFIYFYICIFKYHKFKIEKIKIRKAYNNESNL